MNKSIPAAALMACAALLVIGVLAFLAGEAAGIEGLATAGAWMTVPATALCGAVLVAVVVGYGLAGLVTCLVLLVRALRRCRPGSWPAGPRAS